MLTETTLRTEFPLIEELRTMIRAAGITAAPAAEVRRISVILDDSVTNSLLDEYEIDAETQALDRLFIEERLPRNELLRFYRIYIDMQKSSVDR